MTEQALAHLKVLDLSHYIAGPFCTKLLAGLGAEVIKVEKPGTGDGARAVGPFHGDDPHLEKSLLFFHLNGNKKSITLNLKTETGIKIVKELVREADIVVENFEPRVLPSLGLSYATLQETNPHLIMTSITNFGDTGPYRDYKAQDIVAYALGGLMYTVGSYEREPLKHGLSQAQMLAGADATVGTMTALCYRWASETGQHVDVSIQEMVSRAMISQCMWYAYEGAILRRQPKGGAGFGAIMQCKDGHISPLVGADSWDLFTAFMDIPELSDPAFADAASRALHAQELNALLLREFMKRGKHELFHSAQEWGFPWAMVQDPADIANCPQLQERDYWAEIEHEVMGKVRFPGIGFQMTETPWRSESPAPLLGQHNREIYVDRLGFSSADLAKMKETGII